MVCSEQRPLVTIITVSLNSDRYIKDAIESVLNQDYTNFEYIIVDGLSTDNTLQIIKEYESIFKGKLKWVSEKDNGLYDAMNKGIALANGEIIGILNSDDYYEKATLKQVVENINQYHMVHGNLRFVDSSGKAIKVYRHKKGTIRKYISTPFNHPTMFVKKQVYEDIGSYNENYLVAADYDFMLRFYRQRLSDIYLDRVITNMRTVGVTSSAAKVVNPEEIYAVLVNSGLPSFLAKLFVSYRKIRVVISSWLHNYPVVIKSIRKWSKYHKDEFQ